MGVLTRDDLLDLLTPGKRTYGPLSAKPNTPDPSSCRYGTVVEDDGGPITFRWHWPRGTFDKRMSAYEIAEFIVPHMGGIIGCGLLSGHPRVDTEFRVLFGLLADVATFKRKKKELIDRVVPWVRRLDYCEDDEILLLDLNAKDTPVGPVHFVMGGP